MESRYISVYMYNSIGLSIKDLYSFSDFVTLPLPFVYYNVSAVLIKF